MSLFRRTKRDLATDRSARHEFQLPSQFAERLNHEAQRLSVFPEDHLTELLEEHIAPLRNRDINQRADYSKNKFSITGELSQRVQLEAAREGLSPEELIVATLGRILVPGENLEAGVLEEGFERLQAFLKRIPAIKWISACKPLEPTWWVKFSIDLRSPIAWHVVQNLAFVLNGVSISERLPTIFKPDSPPPYLNGGPREYLNWVIEATIPLLNAAIVTDFLEERLPSPVEDESSWLAADQDADEDIEDEPVDIEAWTESRRQPEVEDCERIGKIHKWFNIDGTHSACYNCRVVRQGQLWRS